MPSLDERVDAHVSKGLWTKVAREIEMYDCEQPGTPATAVVYAKGLLSYLICGELNGARFLFRRLPEAEQNDPSVTAVWEIGKALWRHDTKGAHEEIARHTWSNELHPIVDALQQKLRENTVALLSSAYSSIAAEKAASLLNLTAAELATYATSASWTYDAATDSYLGRGLGSTASSNSHGVAAITSIAKHAFFLEQAGIAAPVNPE